MDAVAARAVLGIDAGATPDEVRAAYRARLRQAHPDLHGVDRGTSEVVAAYRVLSAELAIPEAPVPERPGGVVVAVDGDTVVADLPAGDLFALLVEAGESVGEVAYLDRHNGVLEVVVEVPGYGACSILLTLQGRAAGHTEAWCTVERLSGGAPPPTHVVTALLADGLASVGDQ